MLLMAELAPYCSYSQSGSHSRENEDYPWGRRAGCAEFRSSGNQSPRDRPRLGGEGD